jgi:hypothetical protein
MPHVMSTAQFRTMNTQLKSACIVHLIVDIGASGAPTVNTASGTGFTVTRANAGEYTATMPTGSRGVPLGNPAIIAATDQAGYECRYTAFSPTAGTFSFETYDTDANDAHDDLPSGTKLIFAFLMEGG